MRLHITDEAGESYSSHMLGDVTQSVFDRYKKVVKGEFWQGAETLGEYNLVGCSVGQVSTLKILSYWIRLLKFIVKYLIICRKNILFFLGMHKSDSII